ncbi:MAG TPA: hypothetical protein VMG08_05220 [Allosphingosinicella sp.]|nr:hypothetical protein [Allosphingosinicella sp.]
MRCTGTAWLFAWVISVFLPSAVIAALGLSGPAQAAGNIFAASWKVADDMAPAAKLLLGALLLLFLALSARRLKSRLGLALLVNALLGALAMIAPLLLLPADWSRGFGIGLGGARLDPALLPVYLGGGIAAGLLFTLLQRRCAARQARP